MRRTRTTERVLRALLGQTGRKSSEIADELNIDAGQLSRLLGRLEREGLVENEPDRRARGRPNSWALTGRGRELACAPVGDSW